MLLSRIRKHLPGYLFLVPALIVFGLFSWYPIIQGLLLSFRKWTAEESTFVGLDNFRFVLSDPVFAIAWKNTVMFVVLGLLFGYLVPLVMAITMNEMRRLKGFLRVAYYLPSVLPGVVVIMLWKWIYDPAVGVLNMLLKLLHMQPSMWYQNSTTVIPSLVLMSIWTFAGSTALIYLAALQNIPGYLYESAELDGAGPLQKLWHITLPQVRGVMLVILVLQIIGTTQTFVEPLVMTAGGPNNASMTVMLLIYRYAFQYYNFGAAAAAGLILFVVLVLFSLLYFWLTRKVGSADGT
ncbi:MAG: carbohydrate ABC transporter permease [Mycobacterium leprae]